MMKLGLIVVVLLALALAGCGSSIPFAPVPGPFGGTLTTSAGPIGQFNLTYAGGLVSGTGMLTVNGDLVPVGISAVLRNRSFSGELRNQNLGGGTFAGTFTSTTTANGTFTFIDTAETVSLSGTWTATAASGN